MHGPSGKILAFCYFVSDSKKNVILYFLIFAEYCERRYFRAVHVLGYSRLSNIRKNMYFVKITFIMLHRGETIKAVLCFRLSVFFD